MKYYLQILFPKGKVDSYKERVFAYMHWLLVQEGDTLPVKP